VILGARVERLDGRHPGIGLSHGFPKKFIFQSSL
jgi:hypothetical protein